MNMKMKYQRGVTLTGLILWGVVIGLVAMLATLMIPEYVNYYKIKKCVASTAHNAGGKTVPEIREIYEKYAEVDSIDTIRGTDLEITKEGNSIVVGFAYEKRVPLVYNVNLLLEFEGSSRER
jgi:Tfp pilus assembly major pilin PilA